MVARTIRLCPKHRDLPIVVGKTVLPECADCGTVRTSDPTDGLAEVLKLARAGYDRGERRPLSDRYEQLEEHQAAAVRAWLRVRMEGPPPARTTGRLRSDGFWIRFFRRPHSLRMERWWCQMGWHRFGRVRWNGQRYCVNRWFLHP